MKARTFVKNANVDGFTPNENMVDEHTAELQAGVPLQVPSETRVPQETLGSLEANLKAAAADLGVTIKDVEAAKEVAATIGTGPLPEHTQAKKPSRMGAILDACFCSCAAILSKGLKSLVVVSAVFFLGLGMLVTYTVVSQPAPKAATTQVGSFPVIPQMDQYNWSDKITTKGWLWNTERNVTVTGSLPNTMDANQARAAALDLKASCFRSGMTPEEILVSAYTLAGFSDVKVTEVTEQKVDL